MRLVLRIVREKIMTVSLNNTLKFKTKKPIKLDIPNIIKEKIDRSWKEFIKNKKCLNLKIKEIYNTKL